MVCRLLGTKPLPEFLLTGPQAQTSRNFESEYKKLFENVFKMLFIEYKLFRSGLKILTAGM